MGALHDAAAKGDLEEIKKLLTKGNLSSPKNVNEKDSGGNTPLIWAAAKNSFAIMRYLVEQGAALNEKNNEGETALICAARMDYLDVVRYLAEKDAQLNEKDNVAGYTALIWAACMGYLDVVRCLAEKGAKLDEQDNQYGHTALGFAAAENHFEMVCYLVRQGALWDIKNNEGKSALDFAKQFRDAKPENKDTGQILVDYLSNQAQKEWGMDVKKNTSNPCAMLKTGEGVTRDILSAHTWYQRAATVDEKHVIERCKTLGLKF